MAPLEAVLDERAHVKAVRFKRDNGETLDLPARTVCVAAGTSPNVIYEKEYPGTFELDERKQYFRAHAATIDAAGPRRPLEPARDGFLHELPEGRADRLVLRRQPRRTTRAASSRRWRARRMATRTSWLSSRRSQALDPASQAARDGKLRALFAKLDDELVATVHQVNRLTPTIVEIVVHAPIAARKFQPGPVLPAAELRDVRARGDARSRGRRRRAPGRARAGTPRHGGPRAHGRLGRHREGPARDDRARDGRQLAALRGARRRASPSS